jgi:hypothetical protein
MIHRSSLTLGLAALAFGVAQAQGSWGLECIDPANTTPFSADYQGRGAVLTDLIGINYGISGTATYGGDSTMGAPCFDPARTYDAAGRFAFGVPGAGSAQSGFDDGMAYSMGW